MSYKDEIKFGTDGWRGVIADNFTFKNVAVAAQAIADWVKADFKEERRVAVGYDARFLSREFAGIVAGVLAGNDIEVFLSKELIPTPALSYGVVRVKGSCGIMITASHNPASFNGIKIKTGQGGGASRDITNKVEKLLGKTPVKTMALADALKAKKIKLRDFKIAYLAFMKNYVDLKKIRGAKFKVAQDVMHGSGGGIMREVLAGGKVRLEYLREEYNPSFGGVKPEPIADYVPGLIALLKKEKYDLGLILDGDADRIGAVAPGGEFVNAQRILGLIALHLYRNQNRRGGLVKTICGSNIMDNIAAKYNLKLYETPVGFKYISDLMVNEKIIAGGEEAGGIGVQDYIPERDGNLAGLLLLEMMVCEKKNLKQLLDDMEREFGRFYYLRADVDILVDKAKLMKLRETRALLGKRVAGVKDFDGIKLIFEDDSWLMFRPSGTEPLVRVYSEARSLERSQQLIDCGTKLLKKFS
jgi:alpha-D-glucose phosphate-specific phosphoglucomutase